MPTTPPDGPCSFTRSRICVSGPFSYWDLTNLNTSLLQTKAAALLHPAVFLLSYALMLYTGALGLQWRSARLKPAGKDRSMVLKSAIKAKDRYDTIVGMNPIRCEPLILLHPLHAFVPH